MAYNRPPQVTLAGVGLKQNPSPSLVQPPGIVPVTIDAEIATTTNLGVVKIGNNINIEPDGTISVTFPPPCQQCSAILVATDYIVQTTDYYIGVKSTGPTNIFLPENPQDCIQLIIKADMGPPLGTKKVKIIAQGTNTIDGAQTRVLTVPYESVNLISQGNNWHVI